MVRWLKGGKLVGRRFGLFGKIVVRELTEINDFCNFRKWIDCNSIHYFVTAKKKR